MSRIDARAYLTARIGQQLPTLTGKPNWVLAVDERTVLVGTRRSPGGQPVPLVEVQAAIDELMTAGLVMISVESVGYRSAFIGAVLASLPGAIPTTQPRSVRLTARPG